MTSCRRVLIFAAPHWGHLSACLAVAKELTRRGDRASFAFVYPPERWVMREIAAHGQECDWSLRYVRSGLGRPRRDEQWRAVVAAEIEIIRAARPDLVLNDLRFTIPAAGRACGVPVVSFLRCPSSSRTWTQLWGDAQLAPHPEAWLRIPAPGVAHCRPAWVERLTMAADAVQPCPVVGALCTAGPQPEHLRLLLAAFGPLDTRWVVCYSHPDEAAAPPAVVRWADHDRLLAGAGVLVCHGGHQLIWRAIAHGVPVVVLETGDNHPGIYGAALEAASAGILIRRRDLAVRAIREATARALDDAGLRRAVAALQRSVEDLPDPADVLDVVLRRARRPAGAER